MSDGEPMDFPTNEVDQLKKREYFSKIQFNACGFGYEMVSQLEVLANLFPNGKMTKAPTVEELKKSMLFILRADNSGPSNQNNRSANNKLKPLWNREKLQANQYFSSISYLQVQKIEGDTITVQNSLGGSWMMSKDLLVRDAWSADLYAEEIKTNMTELALILTMCKETVFTVSFKKKV